MQLSVYHFWKTLAVLIYQTYFSLSHWLEIKVNKVNSKQVVHTSNDFCPKEQHWLEQYGSADALALCRSPQWQSILVRVYNETINCFHDCCDTWSLAEHIQKVFSAMSYVSNIRNRNICFSMRSVKWWLRRICWWNALSEKSCLKLLIGNIQPLQERMTYMLLSLPFSGERQWSRTAKICKFCFALCVSPTHKRRWLEGKAHLCLPSPFRCLQYSCIISHSFDSTSMCI